MCWRQSKSVYSVRVAFFQCALSVFLRVSRAGEMFCILRRCAIRVLEGHLTLRLQRDIGLIFSEGNWPGINSWEKKNNIFNSNKDSSDLLSTPIIQTNCLIFPLRRVLMYVSYSLYAFPFLVNGRREEIGRVSDYTRGNKSITLCMGNEELWMALWRFNNFRND